MIITIRLHACFIFLSGDKNGIEELELKEGIIVNDIIKHYKIKPEYVAIVTINKKIVNCDYEIHENDLVEIFPVFGGG